jgi:2-keto-3-deoxy-L-fuconate dehydrogenase
MNDRLRGKRALVTAAAHGIGRAIANRFAQEGADVLATDIDESALNETNVRQKRRLDVTDCEAIGRLASEQGPLDVLVNCAGYVHVGTILDASEADWDRAFDVNARSMFRLIKAFLPGMLDRGKGSIVNVASVASSVKGVPNRFVYTASKAAVIGITKSIAIDFIKNGIRCNAICPGTVDSPSLSERIKVQADKERTSREAIRAAFIARQPMGRLGQPEEIAGLAAYLASDEAEFVTGQAHLIDGGMVI